MEILETTVREEGLTTGCPHSATPLALPVCVHVKSLQLCPILCDPMDCNLQGSFVHGILQARILEWVAMPSSRGSSQPRDKTCASYVSCIDRCILDH